MNDIQCLIDRQLGLNYRLNYDNVLKRLTVHNDEAFYGLQSAGAADTFDPDPPIFACRFSEAAGFENILALANENGRVGIQNTTDVNTANEIESFQCHNNAVFDLAWMPGYMSFVTVSGDHTSCLWDVGEGGPRRVVTMASHTRSVKTAVFSPGASVVATGGRDGAVLVWDLRVGAPPVVALRPDNRLAQCHAPAAPPTPPHGKRSRREPRAVSITGLAFQDPHTLLSCAECDGNIKLWDLRKNYSAYRREPLPRRAIPYCGSSTRLGYSHLALDEPRTRLFASCMDGVIYCFNLSGEGAAPERRYLGHESGTFYIKASLSSDGEYLVSGSSDKRAYVWSVRRSEPLVRLPAHHAEVTCAAWRACGDLALVTCSDDARHMIWRIGRHSPEPEAELARAEPAPPAAVPLPPWGALDRTPSSSVRKRGAGSASADRGAKRPRPALPPRKGKRCLASLLNSTRDSEDAPPSPKRIKIDPTPLPGNKRPRDPSPDPNTASEEATVSNHVSPSKEHSPSPEPVKIITFSTPTKDLPNFVLTGEAPHLRLMSPAKKKPETTDWLTQLVRERRIRTPDIETSALSKENVPTRRNSTTDKTPKSSKNSITLYKYFNVTNKEK